MSQEKEYHEKVLELLAQDKLEELEKVPLAQLIAAASCQRDIQSAFAKQEKKAGEIFKAIEMLIIDNMQDQSKDGVPLMQAGSIVDGTRITATITEQEVPTAKDWEEIWGYIKENDAFHLMQKRLSATACTEEAKFQTLQGIEFLPVTKLALRRTKM